MTTPATDVNLFDPAVVADPYRTLATLRERAPVHRIAGTSFFVVTRHDLVVECLTRTADFSSNLTAVLVHDRAGAVGEHDLDSGRRGTHVLATGDDPSHRAHRKLVLPTLVAKRIAALEPFVAVAVERLWERSVRRGSVDWMNVADALPLELVTHLIGLPRADAPLLRDLSYASTEMLGGVVTTDDLPRALTAAVELAGYLHAAFTHARSAPGDDLLGDLVRACATSELTPDVAVLILVQLVGAGGESTAGLLGNAAHHLALHPGAADVLRAGPDRIPAFLDEVLRLEAPFRGHSRHVVADTRLAGVELPAGSHLVLSWSSANRDPAVFGEPDRFVLDRPNIRSMLSFGRGLHFCVGAALARLEARVAIQLLLARSQRLALRDAEWHPSIFVRRLDRLVLEL